MKRLIFMLCLNLISCGSESESGSQKEISIPVGTTISTETSPTETQQQQTPVTDEGSSTISTANEKEKALPTNTEVTIANTATSTSTTTATATATTTVSPSAAASTLSTSTTTSTSTAHSESPQVDLAEVQRVRTLLFPLSKGQTWVNLSKEQQDVLAAGNCKQDTLFLGFDCVVSLWRGEGGLNEYWYYFSITFDQPEGTIKFEPYHSYNHYDGYSGPDVPVYKDLVTRDQVKYGDVVIDNPFLAQIQEGTIDPRGLWCTPENRYHRSRAIYFSTETARISLVVVSLLGKVIQGQAWVSLTELKTQNHFYDYYYINLVHYFSYTYSIPIVPDGCELANPDSDGRVSLSF
jgi:hypothetical protein